MRPISASEQKIIDLSAKVVALQDTPEFWPAVQQLRTAIHDHVSSTREKVSDLAFLIANESKSNAAD
jgi:hypothetical protein